MRPRRRTTDYPPSLERQNTIGQDDSRFKLLKMSVHSWPTERVYVAVYFFHRETRSKRVSYHI